MIGTDTTITHHYFNDVSKEEIAVLKFNAAQNAVTSVVYKNILAISPAKDIPDASLSDLQVYPNPAASRVTFRCSGALPGTYTFSIFSSTGAVVTSSVNHLTSDTTIEIQLPPGMNGLYFCRLDDAKGNIIGTSKLIVGM